MGGQFLNLLYKLGGIVLNAIPMTSLLEKAYSFLIESPTLPAGIAIMREDSEELALLNAYGDGTRVISWGAQFPIDSNRSGFGILTTGALLGAMAGIGNDLVVPTHSALGFGIPQPILNCSHTQYFEEPKVHMAIKSFYPAPAVQAAAAAAVAGAGPFTGNGGIQRVGGNLFINGVRIPVNMRVGGLVA